MALEELNPITPVNFFQISWGCHYLEQKGAFPRLTPTTKKKYLVPATSALCDQEHFTEVSMGWNEEGIEVLFEVGKEVEKCFYPDVIRGDSVELFIDTRDVKTSGYNTRFCHHFFFLPEAVEGVQAGEKTHFRTEDRHDLCDPDALQVKVSDKGTRYVLHGWIPSECLHGFDQSERIGFTYRINRPYWESQHFSVVTDDFKLEEQPALWSSVRLVS